MRKNIVFLFLLLMPVAFVNGQSQNTDDFKIKGFYLDFRNEVMTPQAIKDFAKELAGFGINTLFIEWEGTYPYQKHATISNKLAFTRKEIADIVQYCNSIGIDLVPSQECFGHVQYILRHDRYYNLRVNPSTISQVCACDLKEDSLLFASLFSDMASLFTSKYIFIGGDETRMLGKCKACKEKMKKYGKDKVYADYMKMMSNIVLNEGKIPVMWADMILKHPKAAGEIPRQTIMIDWNYGWDPGRFGDATLLQKKGFTFWGAPAIRSGPDDWFITDWEKHFNNQRDFIPYARKEGYTGMVMTAWSTSGVYGFTRGQGNEIIDMQPIRNNYPLSGFRILIAAYAASLKQKEPIDPQKFVIKYAERRFGLTADDGKKLWEALTNSFELIRHGQPAKSKSISKVRLNNNRAQAILNHLTPHKNKKEFEQYRLMADLRDYYLRFQEIKASFNAADFTRDKSSLLIGQVEKLKKNAKKLDKRFYKLNKGFLYDSEIERQQKVRNRPVNILYKQLLAINIK